MDDGSRELVRQRFGANRKQITTFAPVRAQGVQQEVIIGSVIENWVLSGLQVGNCIVSLPEGPPFFFAFDQYSTRTLVADFDCPSSWADRDLIARGCAGWKPLVFLSLMETISVSNIKVLSTNLLKLLTWLPVLVPRQ